MSELTEHHAQLALLHADALPENKANQLQESLTSQDRDFLTSLDKVQKLLHEYGKTQLANPPQSVFERINAILLQENLADIKSNDIYHRDLITVIPESKAAYFQTRAITLKKKIFTPRKAFSTFGLLTCFTIIVGVALVSTVNRKTHRHITHPETSDTLNSEIFNFDDTHNNASNPRNTIQSHKAQAMKCLQGLGYPLFPENNIISLSQGGNVATVLFHFIRNNNPETLAVTVPSTCLSSPGKKYPYQERIISGKHHN